MSDRDPTPLVPNGGLRLAPGDERRASARASGGTKGQHVSGQSNARAGAGSGPLSGIRVVEIASFMSGPYAGLQLADLGATVVKVEPPSGDPYRTFGRPRARISPHWASINRGKQSVVLDLKSDDGRTNLLAMLADADVLLANWRPRVAASLELTDDVVAGTNRCLIRAYITGYGPDGPASEQPAFDTAVQARSGMMDAFAPGDEPVVVPGYPCDKATALVAAQAILAALFVRERTGEAERVDVSMLDVAASTSFPDLYPNRVFVDRQPRDPHNRHSMHIRPVRTADGFLMVAPGTGRQMAAALRAVGAEQWIDEVFGQPDQASMVAAFFGRVESAVRSWETLAALRVLRDTDVPCAQCATMDEHFDDEQVVHNELYGIRQWSGLGRVRVVRHPARFGSWSVLLAGGAPPELGQHNDLYVVQTPREP